MINNSSLSLNLTATIYLPLRSEPGGRLTLENVRRARWNLTAGSTVRLSIYGLGDWEAGVPELIGRRLAESSVASVELQASTSPGRLKAFREAVIQAADDYWAAVADADASGRYISGGEHL